MVALAHLFLLCLFVAVSHSTNLARSEMESSATTTPLEAFHQDLCKSVPSTANRSMEEFILFFDFNLTTRSICYDSTINQSSLQVCFNRSQGVDCRARFYQGKEFYHVPFNGTSVETSNDIREHQLLMCFGDCGPEVSMNVSIQKHKTKYRLWTKKAGVYVKLLCVAAYLVLFSLVPALRNPAGYNVASMTLTFFVTYFLQLIDMTPALQPDLPHFCWTSAVVKYYFGMVAMFSMNAMSFTIWRTLNRSTRNFVVSSARKGLNQYIWCFAYSWGVPILLVLVLLVVDSSPNTPADVRPQFEMNNSCFFTTNKSQLLFMSLPITTLVVSNAVFFVLCALIIRKGSMKCKEGDRKQKGIRVTLYLRLGVMMGGTWVFSSLSAILARTTNKMIFWFAFDIFSATQGPIILLIFACNKYVYNYFLHRVSGGGSKTSSEGSAPRINGSTCTSLASISNSKL